MFSVNLTTFVEALLTKDLKQLVKFITGALQNDTLYLMHKKIIGT